MTSRGLRIFTSALVALLIMVGGQRLGRFLFPVTLGVSATPDISGGQLPFPLRVDVALNVPSGAYEAHLLACAAGALAGGFLLRKLVHGAAWPVWFVGAALAAIEVVTSADIPKSWPFRLLATAICIAAAWAGAGASRLLQSGR